jgi:hypothetical protein
MLYMVVDPMQFVRGGVMSKVEIMSGYFLGGAWVALFELGWANPKFDTPKGGFTPWTMKSDHGRWPFSMVRLDGPTFMVGFHKKINLQSLWAPH